MKFNKKIFVIVDAYTIGGLLAPFFNANGYECIHIQSREQVLSTYKKSFIINNFLENILYKDNLDIIAKKLLKYDIKAIIPGSEPGVLLADQLNEILNIKTSNGILYSNARRNKYEMVQRLIANSIPHARSFNSSNLSSIITWINANNLKKVILKPLASAGTYGVTVCNNLYEIEKAFYSILHHTNLFLELNTSVMVQEFLYGQEYIINTVSYNGVHKVIDIWRKFKKIIDNIPISDYSELVSPLEKDYNQLQEYVFKVLNALNINYGAGHSEVMIKDRIPILIETAARVTGSVDMSAATEALGDNQVCCLGKSYINPQEFLKSYKTQLIPNKYVRQIFFISQIDGHVINHPNLDFFLSLKCFHSITFRLDKGDSLVKTTTLINSPGFCYLISHNKNEIEKDYIAIRNYEYDLYHNMCGL